MVFGNKPMLFGINALNNSVTRTEQVNGREGETATLCWRCPLNSSGLGGGFAPRHFRRYVLAFILKRCKLEHIKEQNMKTLRCRDAGFDCEGKISAASEEEILSQAVEHARTEHNVLVTPELAEQLKTLIKDEEE